MKDDLIFLSHMVDAIRDIENYTDGGENAFYSTKMIQDAVSRNLEVIGEAEETRRKQGTDLEK